MILKLIVAGDGPEKHRIERLRAQFPERVTFHGFLPFDGRLSAFAESDVLIFPSNHDGWGVAVHEAMASGMPVISSSAVGSAIHLIEDGESGFVIPAGDIERFTRAIMFSGNPQKGFRDLETEHVRARSAVRPNEVLRSCSEF